ncbi:MAG TPA: DUF4333 domain-containing protein [Baekduia sp.]|uniref:DUF4333 domain-containing protein n=1 Tax=Baekduia sp. TaxID=2600305 RepID=UPI002B759E2F|nr:DUF4333 domain-containing protein [Baekduia sp.]HMJ34707.1 DUF4333 domain-containing protein [Baekduia sp.]
MVHDRIWPGRIIFTALLALTAAALGACGGNVDRKDLETKIADFVRQQTGTKIDVHCPDGVKADEGNRVRCTTELSGAPTDITIQFVGGGRFRITQTRLQTG